MTNVVEISKYIETKKNKKVIKDLEQILLILLNTQKALTNYTKYSIIKKYTDNSIEYIENIKNLLKMQLEKQCE